MLDYLTGRGLPLMTSAPEAAVYGEPRAHIIE